MELARFLACKMIYYFFDQKVSQHVPLRVHLGPNISSKKNEQNDRFLSK